MDNLLIGYSSIVDGQCGIGTIRSIKQVKDLKNVYGDTVIKHEYTVEFPKTGYSFRLLETMPHAGGCSFFGTGFVNTAVSKESYDVLCKRAKLVFQTPVRYNKNSGNMFFYAMFDEIDDPKEDGYLPTLQPKWPFK